ncbi:MAG: putative quinol monooxygenase [Promethearchaeota archaeon]
MEKINKIQVSANIKIPEGKLEEFKQLAIECMKQTRDKDKGTLRYDWFISRDQTECEVREEYKNSETFIEHMVNLGQILTKLFNEFPMDRLAVYGDLSTQLQEMIKRSEPKLYSFFQGLE